MTDTRLLDELPFRDISTSELIDIFSPLNVLTDRLEDNSFYQYIKSFSDTMI